MNTQRRFEVYIGGRLINQVYFDADMSAREVRNSLINHDGLPPTISVYKNDPRGVGIVDVARTSHPEEI